MSRMLIFYFNFFLSAFRFILFQFYFRETFTKSRYSYNHYIARIYKYIYILYNTNRAVVCAGKSLPPNAGLIVAFDRR